MRVTQKAKSLVIILSVVLSLSACAAAGSEAPEKSNEPAPTKEPSESSFAELTLSSEGLNDESTLEAGAGLILDPRSIAFTLGGSGSCPPLIDSLERNGERITLVLAVPEPDIACTSDFRKYDFSLTSELDQFSEATLLETSQDGTLSEILLSLSE